MSDSTKRRYFFEDEHEDEGDSEQGSVFTFFSNLSMPALSTTSFFTSFSLQHLSGLPGRNCVDDLLATTALASGKFACQSYV